MLGTGSTVKEALNKHIIKMRVWGGGVPVQSAGDCEEGYWQHWIKAVQRCQQAGPQYHPKGEAASCLSSQNPSTWVWIQLCLPQVPWLLCTILDALFTILILSKVPEEPHLKTSKENIGVLFLATAQQDLHSQCWTKCPAKATWGKQGLCWLQSESLGSRLGREAVQPGCAVTRQHLQPGRRKRSAGAQLTSLFYSVWHPSRRHDATHMQGGPFLIQYIFIETPSQTHSEMCFHGDP